MAGAVPEETVPFPVHRQRWSHVAFLHWRYDPELLLAWMPPGCAPDVVDGSAWVSLTPLRIAAALAPFRGAPAVPGLTTFAEANVRTYARTADGKDALVFLSLDASSPLPLAARALLGIPYRFSTLSVRVETSRFGERVTYRCRRLGGSSGHAGHDITLEAGARLAPSQRRPIDDELTGRWRAYARPAGRPALVPVRHEPWPLRRVTSLTYTESLLAAAGLPAPLEGPLVHYADGVDAVFGPPRPIGHRIRRVR